MKSGNNVTGDNFFSSGSLCKNLLRKSISYVGTVRANRRELCNHMRRQQDLYATTFYKDSEHKLLLAAYRCKPAKTGFLISTMHKNIVLENDAKSKPELVKFYNQNKVGVDCIDQMIRLYSTRTTTRRWSFAVWCNILDKAAINAWIIYTKITGEKISRRNFIFALVEQLLETQADADDPAIPEPISRDEPLPVLAKRAHCSSEGCKNLCSVQCCRCKKKKCGTCLHSSAKYSLSMCNICAL